MSRRQKSLTGDSHGCLYAPMSPGVRNLILVLTLALSGLFGEGFAQGVSSVTTPPGEPSGSGPLAPLSEAYDENYSIAATGQPEELTPFRIGSLIINPGITVSGAYDDNVFATRNFKEADYFTIVSPQISARASGEQYDVELYATADLARYQRFSSENYDNYSVGAEGSYAFVPDFEIFGGGDFRQDHESRQSPDDVNGLFPTPFTSGQAFAGIYKRFGRLTTRIGGTFERLDFDDVPSSIGTINNDDRDRDVYTIGGRFGYWVAGAHEIFVQGSYNQRDYSLPVDDFGFARSSDGYDVGVGYRYRPHPRLDGEFHLGYLEQRYSDQALENVSIPDFGARFTWRAAARTRISGFIDRSVRETTQPGASSFVSSGGGLALEHAFRRDLFLDADASYFADDYQGTARVDRVTSVSAGLRYYLTPVLFLGLDYAYAQRDSNLPVEDYQKNVVFLRIGAQAQPVYTAGDDPLFGPAGDSGVGEFYGGAHLGLTHLGTELEGTRGGGTGSLTVDFAGLGADAGLFGGFGTVLGDWFLGLELEGEASHARWEHANAPTGRIFSVEKGATFGIGPLFGYRLPSGSMLYGRFGAMVTEFETTYVGARTDAQQREHVLGFNAGIGSEVPLDGGLFLRLDYRYGAYADYDLVDNFANNTSTVRLGLGYRGGAAAGEQTIESRSGPVMDFSGAYGGAQIGFASLDSELRGARQPGRSLAADFGDDGAMGGIYGGFGWAFDRIYVGLEAEAEASDVTWNQQRDPTGRAFSVDKRAGYGASVRLGYVVDDSNLLYLRAGAVRSEFRTRYARGPLNVDQIDTQPGIRIGGGVELPASEHAFVRMDFTYTQYEDYHVDYQTGIDQFRNSEMAFQVGMGYRF